MNEKIKEMLKSLYDSLTDELKEKAKQCNTMEELMKFAEKEGIELPDELLDAVAGGRTGEEPEAYNCYTLSCPLLIVF